MILIRPLIITALMLLPGIGAHAQCTTHHVPGEVNAVTAAPNGDIICVGDGEFFRFSSKGDLLIDTFYDDETVSQVVVDITDAPGPGYIILAYEHSTAAPPFGEKEIFLYYVDENGIRRNVRNVGTDSTDFPHRIIPLKKGGFMILSSINYKGLQYEHTVLIKVDADGKEVWQKTLPDTNVVAYDMVELQDGSFLLAGEKKQKTLEDYWTSLPGETMVMKLSAKGDVLWIKTYADESGEDMEYNRAECIIATDDGNYIIAGRSFTEITMLPIIKINPSGEALWKKYYSGSAKKITKVSDGYLLTGTVYFWNEDDTEQVPGSLVVKIDKGGNKLWEHRRMNEKEQTDGVHTVETKSGYVSIGCSDEFTTFKKIFFTELSKNGCNK